jgi:hypothetical protein
MAIKTYRAKVTGFHAVTNKEIVAGETYDIDESLAGPEVFEPVEEATKTRDASRVARLSPTNGGGNGSQEEV